jgi:hypothetical protein
MTTPVTRTRRTISLDVNKNIINSKKSSSELANEFDLPYPTVDKFGRAKEKIQEAIDGGIGGKRAKIQPVKSSKLEEALLKWLTDVRRFTLSRANQKISSNFNYSVFSIMFV